MPWRRRRPASTCSCRNAWRARAEQRGLDFCVYLGHEGSYIYSEDALAEALEAVPNLGLKIDPAGLIRNLKADPNDILFRFGANLVYFHVKGHGPYWSALPERRKAYVRHTLRALGPYMGSG